MNLKLLVAKLNTICRHTLESAAGVCITHTHYEIEVEHWLLKLVELDNTDIQHILRHYEINLAHISIKLEQALSSFTSGNTRNPVFAQTLPKLLASAWLIASINCGEKYIRSGHILLALLTDTQLSQQVKQSLPLLFDIPIEDLQKKLEVITKTSQETSTIVAVNRLQSNNPIFSNKAPALDRYTVNLSEQAQAGLIDPVLGRDNEIRQMIDILMRRRQNNPILTGEAGVGKTAVVEGLALKIAAQAVPVALANVQIRILDLGLLQAGASVKGEFESRLKSVIDEVKASVAPIILFIDEAHTLIGAGGPAGQQDAANLLKPALARGELRTIAATTWSEYKKYFEKDPALTRRFQVVKVDEPSEEQALIMLRGLLPNMQQHHQVRIIDEALIAAVKLSNRYITGRQLPDKAVSLLDTACASVALGLGTVPAAIENLRQMMTGLATEIEILQKEVMSGAEHQARIKHLMSQKQATETGLKQLEQRWQNELECVNKIHALQNQIEAMADKSSHESLSALCLELNQLKQTLSAMQQPHALVEGCVNAQKIAAVVSAWTGVPLGKVLQDELKAVCQLQKILAERVLGQDHALEAIAQRIHISRANLEDPEKPIAVFMLVGPSGVGKTETALALAESLYGGERNLITINMSEFQEAHTVSTLKGSPPGYVGYGEGGILTEAVRRKPYSVVLLDEVEKAHPDVLELFFQVFDKGVMDDAEGRTINFKNTVILLTSNIGTETIMQLCSHRDSLPSTDFLKVRLQQELSQVFKPAFIGRVQVVPYYPVQDQVLHKIICLKLDKIKRRIKANHNADFVYPDKLIQTIALRCTEVDSGARNIDYIISSTLLPDIAQQLLAKLGQGEVIHCVSVSIDEETQQFSYVMS